jgi:hypothetical protein
MNSFTIIRKAVLEARQRTGRNLAVQADNGRVRVVLFYRPGYDVVPISQWMPTQQAAKFLECVF